MDDNKNDQFATTAKHGVALGNPEVLYRLVAKRGALFSVSPGVNLSQVALFHNWTLERRLQKGTDDMVQAIIALCRDDPDQTTDIHALMEHYGKSRNSILNRCDRLIDAGLMRKELIRIPGRRSVSMYTLGAATEDRAPELIQELSALPLPVEHADADLTQNDLIPLDIARYYSVKGDLFSIYTLASILPSGKSGGYTERNYECPIRIGKEIVSVEVRPTHGTKVASVLDLRVLIAIITIITRRMEKGGPKDNPFVIEVEELAQLMTQGDPELRLRAGGRLKSYLIHSIERWESTGFKIVRATNGFVDKFRGRIELQEVFRNITKLKILSYVGHKGKTPGRVAIYLDDDLLSRIRDPDVRFLISTHSNVLSEQNPFALRFGLWCRRAVQHNHTPRTWSLSWVHGEIEPLRERRRFLADLRALYKKHEHADRSHACYGGYNFFIESPGRSSRDGALVVWANPEDRLVGTKSHYAFTRKVAQSE